MGKKSGKTKFKAPQVKNTGASQDGPTRAKKEAVTGSAGSGGGGKSTYIGLGIAVLVIAIVGYVIFGGGGSSSFAVVTPVGEEVRIPLAEINDGRAHFYTFKGKGSGRDKDINFFILKSSDGVIRAAFDSCDVCYQERKGYRQEGDRMVCNNCGQQFPSVKINELRGGCNPAPLERAIEGDYLVVKVSDIGVGGFYF
jgi:hypothetical protein